MTSVYDYGKPNYVDEPPAPTSPPPEAEIIRVANVLREKMANHPKHPYPSTPISDQLCTWAAHLGLAGRHQFIKPAHGLALFGGVGTGKTTAVRCISALLGFPCVAVSSLDVIYARSGDVGIIDAMEPYNATTIAIDDIGTERARHFGAEFPMVDILSRRYDLWQRYGVLTVLTGNLTAEERLARYGTRIVDRLAQMCVVVPCVWPSFRRAPGAKGGES